jgi:hypothetical protein
MAICEGRDRQIGIATMDFEAPVEIRVLQVADTPTYSHTLATAQIWRPRTLVLANGTDRATPLVQMIRNTFSGDSGVEIAVAARRTFTSDVADYLTTAAANKADAVSPNKSTFQPDLLVIMHRRKLHAKFGP